jgi:hypothetical protein
MFDSISVSALFASVLWGALGSGMMLYGWRQKSMQPLGVGFVITAISYFFLSSALYMSLASGAVLGAMWWLRKQGY